MQKRLSSITSSFEHFDYETTKDPIITDICFDSRKVVAGSMFFALPGIHVHGNTFILQAIENGAAAIVFQDDLPQQIKEMCDNRTKNGLDSPVFVRVKNARTAMSPASATFYDNPSSNLAVIGVTGTEGKSSTVSFIWQLLKLCGKKAGFISTVQYSLGSEAIANPEHQTTPEAPIVQKQLYQMVQNGCEYAVVESSSHGLSAKTNRLGNVMFDVGVWMNVTHEHLEFHGTHEQYKNDKANLFRNLDKHNHEKKLSGRKTSVPSFGVINLEDPAWEYFALATKYPVYGFSSGKAVAAEKTQEGVPVMQKKVVPFTAKKITATSKSINFTADTPEGNLVVTAPLSGTFNVYNVLASIIAVSKIATIPIKKVAAQCLKLEPVIGRMTVISQGQPFTVIVDYAHTPSSFQTIFPPLRKQTKGRIFALFGSGGERDIKKRPEQGKIAAKYCDVVILTDEDPRGEDSIALLEMIAKGCRKSGKTEDNGLFIIPSRQEAIRKAFAMAQEDDMVLLLGKAHENSIIYKNFVMPYDEIAEAKKALEEMGYTK